MKNLHMTRNAQIVIPAPVPENTLAGNVVHLGTDGLIGLTLTDRVTTTQLNNFDVNTPQGLKNGEASVELIGAHISVHLTVAGSAGQFDAVYLNDGGTYDLVDTGTLIGFLFQQFHLTLQALIIWHRLLGNSSKLIRSQ